MIPFCKNHLITVLQGIGISTIYTLPEDESRHKGFQYAFIAANEPEQLTSDGRKVGYSDNPGKTIRTFYKLLYAVTTSITVKLADKNEAAAVELKNKFLAALTSPVPDENNCAVELLPLAAELISDKNILKTGAGYSIIIQCTGGIYQTSTTLLIPAIELEGEFIKEV